MGIIANRIREAGKQAASAEGGAIASPVIDEREQAIIARHTSEAPKGAIFQKVARGAAEIEIDARRKQREYVDQAPRQTVETVRELLPKLTGNRPAVLEAIRQMTPEQREEALRLAPGVAQQLGDNRGNMLSRGADAIISGISGVSQPVMELMGTGGTPEEIEYIRQLESAAQEFHPYRPGDPWYEKGPLQATEMVPWMATVVGGGGAGRAAATTLAKPLAARAAARAGMGRATLSAAGKAGELAGITAAAFPGQYAQEVDQLKEIGMEDGTNLRLLAGGTAAITGLIEGIVPNPLRAGKVSLTEGAAKAARQYLWESAKKAPGEMSEEYLQGVTSGLGKHVAQYLDENAEDKSVVEAFETGWEQAKEAALPMAFLMGVPAVGGAGLSAARAQQLQKALAKGYVSEEEAKQLGIEGKNRKERRANATAELQQTTQAPQYKNWSDFGTGEPQGEIPPPPGLGIIDRLTGRSRQGAPPATQSATLPPRTQPAVPPQATPPLPTSRRPLPPLPTGIPNASQIQPNEARNDVQGNAGEGSQVDSGRQVRLPGQEQGSTQQASEEPQAAEVPVESTTQGEVDSFEQYASEWKKDLAKRRGVESKPLSPSDVSNLREAIERQADNAIKQGRISKWATDNKALDELEMRELQNAVRRKEHEVGAVRRFSEDGVDYVGFDVTGKQADPVSELEQAEDEFAGLFEDEPTPAPTPQVPVKPEPKQQGRKQPELAPKTEAEKPAPTAQQSDWDVVRGTDGKLYRMDPNAKSPSERMRTRQPVDPSEGTVLITKDQWGKPIPPETLAARKEFVDKAKPGTEFRIPSFNKNALLQVQDDGKILSIEGTTVREMSSVSEMANTVKPDYIAWEAPGTKPQTSEVPLTVSSDAPAKPETRMDETAGEQSSEIRRGEVGGKLAAGEVVTTSSGRQTTPFPKIAMDSDRKAQNTVRRVDEWLRQNAVDEARSRGDDFNLRQFESEDPKTLPPASKDAMEEYLFGEQPAVVPPITKPLVQPVADTTSASAKGFADLPAVSRSIFETAMQNETPDSLLQILHSGNKTMRAEFETRTGIKLPKTVKGTKQVVEQWFKDGKKPAQLSAQNPELAPDTARIQAEREVPQAKQAADLPWSNSSTEDESRWYGTKISVAPANRREEPYTGQVVRVLNNGDVVEVQPDGQDGTFRVDSLRITLVEQSGPVAEKKADKASPEPPPEPTIPSFTRTTFEKGSTTRQFQSERVEKARAEIADLERKARAKRGEHDGLRSNATKKRAAVRKDIEFLNRRIGVVQGEIASDMAADTLAKLEDELESPKSYDHYLAGMKAIHKLKASVAEDAARRGEMGREAARTEVSKEGREADRFDAELQGRAKDIAKSQGFTSGDAEQIALAASNGFTVFEDRSLADIVEVQGKRTRESRVSQEIAKLKPTSTYGQKDLSDEQAEEFTKQYQEASLDDKDWLAKRGEVDKAVKDAINANREAVRKREDDERKAKEAERAKDEQEALSNARERAKKYFLDERISKALKKQKPKTKPVKIRQESEGGPVKIVDGKIVDGDRNGELYSNGLILHKTFEDDSNDFGLTHARSGLAFPFSAKKSSMQELIGLIDLLGVDFNVDTDAKGHLPSELISRVKNISTAWDNGDYSMLSDQDYATVQALGEVTKTDIDADLILTADDLGANGIPPGLKNVMTDKGLGLVKQMAIAVPEFPYDPVFTVKDGKLLYRDGFEFKLEPTAFNLHPSELKEGQTVGINLEDLGVKRSTPQDVVADMLKNVGLPRVTKTKGGDVTAGYVGSIPVSIQKGEQDNDWDVVGGNPKVREIVIATLKKIRWRQPGQDGDPKTDLEVNGKDVASQTTASEPQAESPVVDEPQATDSVAAFDAENEARAADSESSDAAKQRRKLIWESRDEMRPYYQIDPEVSVDDGLRETINAFVAGKSSNPRITGGLTGKAIEFDGSTKKWNSIIKRAQSIADKTKAVQAIVAVGDTTTGIPTRAVIVSSPGFVGATFEPQNTKSFTWGNTIENLYEGLPTQIVEPQASKPKVAASQSVEPLAQLDLDEDATDFIKELLNQKGSRPSAAEAFRRYQSNTGVTTGREPASSIVTAERFAEFYDVFATGRDRARAEAKYGDTPIGRQFAEAKAAGGEDTMLMFRMGDFYELYFEDAQAAAKMLGLTLTTRDKSAENPIPMAGFPYHQIDGYLKKLQSAGIRVAISESPAAGKPVSQWSHYVESIADKGVDGLLGGKLKPVARMYGMKARDEITEAFDRELDRATDAQLKSIADRYKRKEMGFDEDADMFSYSALKAKAEAILNSRTSTDSPSAKPKTKLQKAAEKASKELSQAVDEFGNSIKGKLGMNLPLNPEVMAAAAKVVAKAIQAGTLNFAELMERMVTKYGEKMAKRMEPALQKAWDEQVNSRPMDEDGAPPETPQPHPELIPAEPIPLTSVKNAVVDELRIQRGETPMPEVTPQSIQQWLDAAGNRIANDPYAGNTLVEQLISGDKTSVDEIEGMVLQYHYRAVNNLFVAADKKLTKAKAGDDPAAIAVAQDEARVIMRRLAAIETALDKAGTAWGRAGVSRQIFLKQDFSLASMVRRARVANGGNELTDEQVAKISEQAKQIEELQKQLAELEAKIEAKRAEEEQKKVIDDGIKKDIDDTKKPIVKPKSKARIKAEEKVASALAMFGAVAKGKLYSNPIDPELIIPALDVVKAYFDLGVVTFREFMSEVAKSIGAKEAKASKPVFREAWNQLQTAGTISQPALDMTNPRQLTRFAKQVQRTLVENGITEREEVVDGVHEALQEIIPEITRRQTMDALSSYGQFAQLSKDPIDQVIRDINGQLQQLAKLEDMQQGKAPAKTGVERRTPTDEERRLTQLVNEAKRRGGFVVTDPETQLKSAMAAAKTAVRNRIADMNYEIKTGTRVVRNKTELIPDAELEQLRKDRDELQKVHKAMFPPKGATQAQKIASASRALDAAIANLEAKLAVGDISPAPQPKPLSTPELDAKRARLKQLNDQRNALRKIAKPNMTAEQKKIRALDKSIAELEKQLATGNFAPKPRPVPLTSPEIDARQAKLEELRATKKAILDAANPKMTPEQRASRAYEAHLRKQLAMYLEKIAQGDFAPQQKKPPRVLTPSELALKKQLADVKHDFFEALSKYHLDNLSPVGRAIDIVRESAHLSRAIMTSIDLSAVLRQGGLGVYSHPVIARKAASEMWKAIWSREKEFQSMEKLRTRPNAQLYEESGLNITDSEGKLTRQEEAFMGRWARTGVDFAGEKVQAATKQLLEPVAASARAYVTFINNLRADLFDVMVENLGRGGQVTKEEARLIATYINAATGRADLKAINGFAANLNAVLFAPRYVASRFQYLAMPFYLLGSKDSLRVKKLIAAEYARTFTGAAVFIGSLAFLAYLAAGGDDEEEPSVEFNPLSSDFGKVRIGETRIDPLAGLSQAIVISSRLASFHTKSSVTGKIKPFYEGGPYETTHASESWRFLRTKLAPVPGAVVTAFSGMEDVVGQKVTPAELVGGLFVPLSVGEIAETMKHRGIPKGTALNILNLLGASVNTYGPKTAYLDATPEERTKQLNDYIKYMTWESDLPAFSQYLKPEELKKVQDRQDQRRGDLVYDAMGEVLPEKEYKTDVHYEEAKERHEKYVKEFEEFRKQYAPKFADAVRYLHHHFDDEGGIKVQGKKENKPSYIERKKRLNQYYQSLPADE